MPRTLTGPATTEKNRNAGAQITRILEMQWGGGTGTKFYSTLALTEPVTAEGRVKDWDTLTLKAEPGRVGGHGKLQLVLSDADLQLKALFDAEPGALNKIAYLHLWFGDTDWPDDRVTLFGGVLSDPKWSPVSATWRVTLVGFEEFYNRSIGQAITREAFPEVICADCEGQIIPICYGAPVARTPACVIDRPGHATLNATLPLWPLDVLFINEPADVAGFTVDEPIRLFVGVAGRVETIDGSFNDPLDRHVFSIFARSGIYASGTIDGFFGAGGQHYVMLPKTALPDSGAAQRTGHVLYLLSQSGEWLRTMVTYWRHEGTAVVVCSKGQLDISTSAEFALGSTPFHELIWQPGTPVFEDAPWVYVANFLPSQSVVRVEAEGRMNIPGGDSRPMFATYNADQYTVTLNDQSYNAALGRGEDDDGITTIALDTAPVQVGFEELTVWVTHHGIGGLANAAEIIEHLMTHAVLGGIDPAFIDSDSFEAAADVLETFMGFALTEAKKLNDLVSDLAQQAGCLLFWDQGKCAIAPLQTLGSSQLTITNANHAEHSLEFEDVGLRELPTECAGKFQMTCRSPKIELVRSSGEALGHYGRNRRELELWGFQLPSSAAYAVEFWLGYFLHRQRMASCDLFLHALHLRPGDVVTLDLDTGSGLPLFSSVLARIEEIRHQAADPLDGRMELISIKASCQLFEFGVDVGETLDNECDAPIAAPVYVDQTIPFTPRAIPLILPGFSSVASEVVPSSTSGAGTSFTPSGCPADSEGRSVYDTFTDSDGVRLKDHTPDYVHDVAAVWKEVRAQRGNLTISSNKVRHFKSVGGGSATNHVVALIEACDTDHSVQCDVTLATANDPIAGVMVRSSPNGPAGFVGWACELCWPTQELRIVLWPANGLPVVRAVWPHTLVKGNTYAVVAAAAGNQITVSAGSFGAQYDFAGVGPVHAGIFGMLLGPGAGGSNVWDNFELFG